MEGGLRVWPPVELSHFRLQGPGMNECPILLSVRTPVCGPVFHLQHGQSRKAESDNALLTVSQMAMSLCRY